MDTDVTKCITEISYVSKTPFSFFQKNVTDVYDVCLHKVVDTHYFYDINHWWGSIILLVLVIFIFSFMMRMDKKRHKNA